MSGYGIDPYGLGPYGGSAPPVPMEVESPWPNAQVDVLGGDVIKIVGLNFAAPMTCEVLTGVGPGYVVLGQCFMFDARYDLVSSRAFFGTPPLDAGTYHLRLTTPSGVGVLENAITYIPVAQELKVGRVRSAFAKVWNTGLRYLTSNGGV